MARFLKSLSLLICVLLVGCNGDTITGLTAVDTSEDQSVAALSKGPVSVSQVELAAFQASGDIGGGVLTPGTFFPPTGGSLSTLRRYSDSIKLNIHTTGLPAGAYTVWWVIFNVPSECPGGCDEGDLLLPSVMASVFFMDGKVVEPNGVGNFQSRVAIGDDLGTPGEQYMFGPGLLDPAGAEVHLVVKYHGPASDDAATLKEQISTALGSCFDGANAVDLGPPFGINCFDPQAGAHLP